MAPGIGKLYNMYQRWLLMVLGTILSLILAIIGGWLAYLAAHVLIGAALHLGINTICVIVGIAAGLIILIKIGKKIDKWLHKNYGQSF